jgi:hypothetical protein
LRLPSEASPIATPPKMIKGIMEERPRRIGSGAEGCDCTWTFLLHKEENERAIRA